MTTRLKRLTWSTLDEAARCAALSRPAVTGNPELGDRVAGIIDQVRQGKDAALRELTLRFDRIELDELRVDDNEFALAEEQVNDEARAAIKIAIRNIETFHAAQLTDPIRVETMPGVICERVNRPIGAVGLYVPAGSAPLPSTAIMLAVPAKLAECPVRLICTPPRPDGRADPAVVVAARMCGIQDIFKVGGAQAIAAMAYGTETIPKVDKVFGPGNAWVTAAKTAVARSWSSLTIRRTHGSSRSTCCHRQSMARIPRRSWFAAVPRLPMPSRRRSTQPCPGCRDARSSYSH